MNKMIFLVLLFLTTSVFAQGGGQGGQGDCQMSLSLTNAIITPTSEGQIVEQNYIVSRASNNDVRCVFFRLYFSKGLANSYQRKAYNISNDTYDYNLHKSTNLNGVLKEFADATVNNEYIRLPMPARNVNFTGSFFIYVPSSTSQNFPPAGNYTDNVSVSLYRENNSGLQALQLTQPLTVTITMPTEINVSLVDQGATFDPNSTMKTLNFGTIQQNAELRTDLMVDSNTPYKINISAQNNGKMLNGGEAIDYLLTFNSSPVDLSSSQSQPVTVVNTSPARGVKDRYPISVKVLSDPEDKAAGIYEDSITITAIAN